MPARILRDGILRSERVDRLSMAAELFYRRLMSVVDDFGRYEARAKLLKVDCFPLRDGIAVEEVEGWLAECVAADGLVLVYEVGGKKYLQLSDFGQRTRSQSRFPAPPNAANCGDMRSDDRPSLSIVSTPPSFDGQARADDGHMSADCGQMTDTCPPLRAGAIGVGVVCEAEGVVGGGGRAGAAPPEQAPPQPNDGDFEQLLVDLLAVHPSVGSLPLSRLEISKQFQRHGSGDRPAFERRVRESHAQQLAGWTRRTRPVRCPELQYWLADGGWRLEINGPVLASSSSLAAPACKTCAGLQFVLREDGAGIHCPTCGSFGRNTIAFEAGEMRELAENLRPAPISEKQAVAV